MQVTGGVRPDPCHVLSTVGQCGLLLMVTARRLKMGICEGSPRSILPDHMGRADYFGASINQAARFMDAGEGGQGAIEVITSGPASEMHHSNG